MAQGDTMLVSGARLFDVGSASRVGARAGFGSTEAYGAAAAAAATAAAAAVAAARSSRSIKHAVDNESQRGTQAEKIS